MHRQNSLSIDFEILSTIFMEGIISCLTQRSGKRSGKMEIDFIKDSKLRGKGCDFMEIVSIQKK